MNQAVKARRVEISERFGVLLQSYVRWHTYGVPREYVEDHLALLCDKGLRAQQSDQVLVALAGVMVRIAVGGVARATLSFSFDPDELIRRKREYERTVVDNAALWLAFDGSRTAWLFQGKDRERLDRYGEFYNQLERLLEELRVPARSDVAA